MKLDKTLLLRTSPLACSRSALLHGQSGVYQQEVHSRMPAWKATKILETREASQVDLAALGEVTGILFESRDMLNKAIQCLDKLREKKTNEEDTDLDESVTSDSHSSESQNPDKGEDGGSNDQKQSNANAASTGDTAAVPSATGGSTCVSNQGQESSSKPSADTSRQQGEKSSKTDAACKDKQESAPESHKEWFDRVTQRGQALKVCYCLQRAQVDVRHF